MTATIPLELDDKTHGGGYFVSNYPAYNFWTREAAQDAQAILDKAPKPGTTLGLYTHIPFCRRRCHFCYFKVYTDKNAQQIAGYVDSVLTELKTYAQKPFIGGRKPNFIYFGGGTPSYLSTTQLLQLTNGMKALLPWDEVEEVTFECEPGTLTEHKINVLREIGVTRLSLGIENFTDELLRLNGRAHESKEIHRAYGFARAAGFPQINIDLIAGMLGETEDNWRECIRQAIELAPDSITIYQMEIPYNTTIFKGMKEEGTDDAPVATWSQKRGWVDYAFSELEKEGYTVSSAYTAVKNPAKTKFVYRDRLWEGADLLAVGVSSFGHIGGVHYQNEANFVPYIEAVDRGELPIYRALIPTREELLVREFILQMKLGHLDFAYFNDKFDTNVEEKFAVPLARLQDWGVAHIEDGKLELTRDGLLMVDRLLHEFFLPQHRSAK